MKGQLTAQVNSREFGIGLFIKKESIVSKYNYSLYLKVLWFKLGIKIGYKDEYQQWSNRN